MDLVEELRSLTAASREKSDAAALRAQGVVSELEEIAALLERACGDSDHELVQEARTALGQARELSAGIGAKAAVAGRGLGDYAGRV